MSTAEILEETSDVVEKTLDVIENAEPVQIIRNNPYILGAVAAVGITVGAFSGYIFAKKRITTHYESILEEEILKAKEFYSRLNKVDEPTIEDAVRNRIPIEEADQKDTRIETAAAAMRDYLGVTVRSVEEEQVREENIFLKRDDFDYEAALEERLENGGEHPYVISHVEFMENDPDHEQESLTYFEGDDILCDEKDESLEPRYTVGEDVFAKFGYGSNDNNVVYVRNEKLGIDYEILRSRGKYTREVLGVMDEDEIPRRKNRRMRSGDDE